MAGLGVGIGGSMSTKADSESKAYLNTYIHNYFLLEGNADIAKAIRNSGIATKVDRLKKEGQANGADDDGDSKDDKNRPSDAPGDNFLLDYWFIFWDMWNASRKDGARENSLPAQYMMHQMRQQQMYPQQMMPGGMSNPYRMIPGAQLNNLQKSAMNNNAAQRNMNPQFSRMPPGMPQQQQMQRDGSDLENRPQSPNSNGENSSPNPKRPRLSDGSFNPQQMAGPRPPMPGQMPNGAVGNQEAIMMQNGGMNPKSISPADLQSMMGKNSHLLYSQNVANQARHALANFQTAGGFNNPGGPQMSPMMGQDAQFDINMMNNQMRGNVGGSNGGALADYQMQLMLLEQQNKKRLMMARQEQDVQGNPGMMGQPGFVPNTSPHGRTGQSPNGNDTKRNTPKLGQSSPLPDGSMPARTSPGPGNFDQMNMGGHFMPQMNKMMGGEGMMVGGAMRPPGQHPLGNAAQAEIMRNGGGRLPNGAWQNGPMQGQMMPQGPGQMNQADQAQQRGNMPPPPPQAAANGGKPQPSPTQQNAAPPTPSQNTKPAPKKKDTKDSKKKSTKKAQSAANAAPNAEADRPPTPTPQTPATPIAPESHLIKGQQNINQPQQGANGQMQQPGNLGMGQGMQPGNGMDQPFGNIDGQNDFTGFDFIDSTGPMAGDEAGDILGGFDFDTFLGDPSGMNWDAEFAMPGDGLETGAGQS